MRSLHGQRHVHRLGSPISSMTKDRRLLGSFVHGSMANALPQAIGAKLLYPNRQVVSSPATAASPCSWATSSPSRSTSCR